jgi:hypothetical protein
VQCSREHGLNGFELYPSVMVVKAVALPVVRYAAVQLRLEPCFNWTQMNTDQTD